MDSPLLAPLSPQERAEFLGRARRRVYKRGEVVVREGDLADSLHLVTGGILAVRVSTARGETATLNLLRTGDYFGELALLSREAEQRRTATIEAFETSETMCLPVSAFEELRRRHPSVDHMLSSLLARRVDELSQRLLETLYDTLDIRVVRRLAELAEVYGGGHDDAPVTIRLTQSHLADLVGGTRSSVNQVLQRLVATQVVELHRGRIVVLRASELRRRTSVS